METVTIRTFLVLIFQRNNTGDLESKITPADLNNMTKMSKISIRLIDTL